MICADYVKYIFLESEVDALNAFLYPPGPVAASSSGVPIIPIAAAAGGGALILLLLVIVVVVRQRRRPKAKKAAKGLKTTPGRQAIAFENPMYETRDDELKLHEATSSNQGLYDVPSFMGTVDKSNPLFGVNEDGNPLDGADEFNQVVDALHGAYDVPAVPAISMGYALDHGNDEDPFGDHEETYIETDGGYLDIGVAPDVSGTPPTEVFGNEPAQLEVTSRRSSKLSSLIHQFDGGQGAAARGSRDTNVQASLTIEATVDESSETVQLESSYNVVGAEELDAMLAVDAEIDEGQNSSDAVPVESDE